MRTRFNRRSFLKSSAASWLAASNLRNSVAWASTGADKRFKEWRSYGGDPGGMRYSPLDQINRSNIRDLRVAWTYHTGDKRDRPRTTIECTPVVADGLMYITTALINVCALDAASGKLVWRFDPFAGSPDYEASGAESIRGVSRVLRHSGQLIFFELGRAPDPAVQRWQKRLEPAYQWLFDGLWLTRDIPSLIRAGGFRIEQIEAGYLARFPKSSSYCWWGRAQRD